MRLPICGLMIVSLALATAVRGDDSQSECPAYKIFEKAAACKACEKAGACKSCDKTAVSKDCEETTVCVSDCKTACSACEEDECSNDDKACCSSKCDKAGCKKCSAALAEKIAHLEKAAEHLELAGMDEEAESVAERLNDLRCAMLKHKIAEVEKLKAQVRELRQASNPRGSHAWNANVELDPPKPCPQAQCPAVACRQDAHRYPGGPQVLLHLQVAEVSLTALKKLGFDCECLSGGCAALKLPDPAQANCDEKCPFAFQTVDTTAINGLMSALRRENVVKILAEPNLVTVSGRPATYFCGNQVAFPVIHPHASTEPQYRDVGTRIDYVPVLLGNNKIRLEIHPRICELVPGHVVAGNQKIPAFRIYEGDTSIEMTLGQTVALSGMVQERVTNVATPIPGQERCFQASLSRDQVQTLIIVTPELVEAMDPQQVPTARAPSSTQSK